MTNTPKLSLALLDAAQAQKHVTVNEALSTLDTLVQASVIDHQTATPPSDPAPGDAFLLPSGPADAWAGKGGALAIYREGGWLFQTPGAGWTVWVLSVGAFYHFDGSQWAPLAEAVQNANRPSLGINATADTYNRLSVSSHAVLFNAESNDIRIALNKSGENQTASFLFQNSWSGRAEIVLIGDDRFVFKTSEDGATFREGLRSDQASAHVGIGASPGAVRLHVGGAIVSDGLYSGEVDVSPDTAAWLQPPKTAGLMFFYDNSSGDPQIEDGALIAYNTGPTPSIVRLIDNGGSVATTTQWLSGVTGAAGASTVSARTGEIKIENRRATSRRFHYGFLG
ncbi:MAG: DUF2793 domain-containing protein [Neomegalonema sp.]